MKYVVKLFFFVICLILIVNMTDSSNKSIPVVAVEDDNEYKIFEIYTNNLTTKNFNKYFPNTSNIIAVYPKVNAIYKERLGNIVFKCKNSFNIEEFISYYKRVLEKNHYKMDIVNIDYYGITIEKIKIYSNKEGLTEVLNNCSICTIN